MAHDSQKSLRHFEEAFSRFDKNTPKENRKNHVAPPVKRTTPIFAQWKAGVIHKKWRQCFKFSNGKFTEYSRSLKYRIFKNQRERNKIISVIPTSIETERFNPFQV